MERSPRTIPTGDRPRRHPARLERKNAQGVRSQEETGGFAAIFLMLRSNQSHSDFYLLTSDFFVLRLSKLHAIRPAAAEEVDDRVR